MADFRRLPNLAALRAFEAAARHQNFSRAAEELHLTHSAISHQVRALEEELGVALFNRHGKRIAVTPAGQQFAAVLRKSLTDIAAAAEVLQADAKHQKLTISALTSFASRWLAPRLGKFIDQHPDIEVVLQASNQLTDMAQGQVDIGIRFGNGHYPGLSVDKLMDDYFYPVASPRYNGGKLPTAASGLRGCALLRSQEEPWLPWLRAAGADVPEPSGGLVYQDSSLLVRSAAAGDGIALARHVIAMQDIAAGDLVRLFDVAVLCRFTYYMVCLPHALQRPQISAFRTWLLDEVAAFTPPSGCVTGYFI
jgi:LysR family transcriptional regulator, glycine cleavage system transcriptional activator